MNADSASAPERKYGGHGADARSFLARRATAGILYSLSKLRNAARDDLAQQNG